MALKETITSWNDGVSAYQAGDYRESLQKFTEIPDPSARILFNISCALLQLNRQEDALQNLVECVQKDPHLAIGHYHKGIQNLKLQRYAEADSDFDNAIQRMRGCAFIDYTQLGMVNKLFVFQIQCAKAVILARKGKTREAMKVMVDASQDTDEDELKRKAVKAIQGLKTGQTIYPDEVPSSCIFYPPKNLIANLKKREYVAKAKVIASYDKESPSSSSVESSRQNLLPPPPNRAPPSLPIRPAKSAEDLRSLMSPKSSPVPHARKMSADPDNIIRPKGNRPPQRPPLPSTISNKSDTSSTYEPLMKSAKSMDNIFDSDLYEDPVTSSGSSHKNGKSAFDNDLTQILASKFGNDKNLTKPVIKPRGKLIKSDVISNNDSSKDSPPPIPKRNPLKDSVLNNPLPPVPSQRDSGETNSRRPPPPSYIPPPPPRTSKSKALK